MSKGFEYIISPSETLGDFSNDTASLMEFNKP